MCKHLIATAVIALIACISAETVSACDVALQVRNSSGFSILSIGYRKRGPADPTAWHEIDISTPIGSDQSGRNVDLSGGEGDYDFRLSFASQADPIVIAADNICNKTQLIATPGNVFIR